MYENTLSQFSARLITQGVGGKRLSSVCTRKVEEENTSGEVSWFSIIYYVFSGQNAMGKGKRKKWGVR